MCVSVCVCVCVCNCIFGYFSSMSEPALLAQNIGCFFQYAFQAEVAFGRRYARDRGWHCSVAPFVGQTRSPSLSLSQASIQALLRLYEGSIKAL